MEMRGCFTAILLAFILTFTAVIPVIAQAQRLYNDVPTSHFAYEAINWVSNPDNGSLMVGDARGNFNPNRVMTKFEAAQVFAMAAGFRHITPQTAPEERDLLTRSFEMWRPMMDGMATQYSRWTRAFDREISFLLYKGILSVNDVSNFVTRTGAQEQVNNFTRQDAIAWTVRMIGRQAHAQALTIPHHTPFRDDLQISRELRRYIYYAAEAGIIRGTGGYIHPLHNFTRAETAMLLHEVLAEDEAEAPTPPTAVSNVTTITGVVHSMVADTQINIMSATGVDTFRFAQNAIVMIDNMQRTPSFLRENMQVTALIGTNREILTIVGRMQTAETPPTTPATETPTTQPPVQTQSPAQAETPPAQQNRTVRGVLSDNQPFANNHILTIREPDGTTHQFTTQPTTVFSRGNALGITWSNLLVGDEIVAEIENGLLVSVHATAPQVLV